MSALETGASLLHYRIGRKIGQGGMGEVYLAEDTKLGRTVAVKLLPPDRSGDPKAARRLVREARSASALNHPNIVTVHAIEESDGRDFIVMEYVEGEDLRCRLQRGPLEAPRLAELGAEVADALAAAHALGILHRDVKSANILITRQGRAKVLDFGLAKTVSPPTAELGKEAPTASEGLTNSGLVVGTVIYMSPEQTRGEPLDARSDIFSLGTVLYEAATGELPFNGPSALSVMHEIAARDPRPPGAVRPDLPRELDRIIRRALEKQPERRFSSAAEMAEALRAVAAPSAGAGTQAAAGRARRARRVAAAVVVLLLLGAAAMFYRREAGIRRARSSLVRVEELAGAGKYFEAYDLALQARRHLPGDPKLIRLLPTLSTELSVITDPPGARVFLKRYAPDEPAGAPTRVRVGVTPLDQLPIARGSYLLSIEKEGYATVERTISSTPLRQTGALLPPPIRIENKLTVASKVPPGMVAVPGGEYRLVGWNRPSDARVPLGAYFIDRFEVSNQEYKEFIVAGGYLKRQLWRHPVVKQGRTIPWEEAVRQFTDRTGLPGPRSWTNQEFPEGRARHPVTDVSWYEAAAYAAFRGKQLPNVFQWEKAARDGASPIRLGVTMPWGLLDEGIGGRANFKGSGPLPVDALEFGMSPHGCHNMAGNVSEWCLNPKGAGFTTAGGSWADPSYLFGQYGAFPGTYSSNTLGFRCALVSEDPSGGDVALPDVEAAPVYAGFSEQRFRSALEKYRYERSPIAAQVGEVEQTSEWRREKVSFAGAGNERVPAYLYLPRNVSPPFQVIHFVPAGDVWGRRRSLTESIEIRLAALVKSGRALFAVVSKGFIGREWPPDRVPPHPSSIESLEETVAAITDLRRGLDYLETRADADPRRLAYMAWSAGGLKLVLPAVETRYRSVVLHGLGIDKRELEWVPEATPVLFAPHIRGPKLMIHGRYDETAPLKTHAEPYFRLLREPKTLTLYEGGHAPAPEYYVPTLNRWLDETLGPVAR